jgi:hypothetical protein
MSQTISWSNIMYKAMASRGIDLTQEQYHSPYLCIFFVLFIIVGSFVVSNLFVGVVISTYNRE